MTKVPVTYADAPAALIAVWNERRVPLDLGRRDIFPPADMDLAAAAERFLPDPALPRPPRARGHAIKVHMIATDLAGQSELAALNALMIAHLRKERCPEAAKILFFRIWTEQADRMLADLPTRWLISSAITFADHGRTEGERCLGQSLNVLFSMMKLYEFERLHSGLAADRAVVPKVRLPGPMPMGMGAFSITSGGLDVNLLAPIWAAAEREPVLGPLALHLLDRLNADEGGIFRRLALMREAVAARKERRQQRRSATKVPGEP